jgi:hypothetical protein
MTENLKVGYTLSQRALAAHLFASTSWVRREGELVTRHGETWARMEFSNRRCAGYKLMAITPRHDLAAQVKTLGADSLLPPGYKPLRQKAV